ncbi:hypothetical protein ANN_06690 [Periplaneta americana]|uniref:Uncharacterized protein n=1 Tax=Periplaneta americana TaxID=6978 RepID=A0ABQ8TG38_PERAM|nr:hypothetical protein ANN_06690 [Periplaneta americana]
MRFSNKRSKYLINPRFEVQCREELYNHLKPVLYHKIHCSLFLTIENNGKIICIIGRWLYLATHREDPPMSRPDSKVKNWDGHKQFSNTFLDFDNMRPQLTLFNNPMKCDVAEQEEKVQLELCGLQGEPFVQTRSETGMKICKLVTN